MSTVAESDVLTPKTQRPAVVRDRQQQCASQSRDEKGEEGESASGSGGWRRSDGRRATTTLRDAPPLDGPELAQNQVRDRVVSLLFPCGPQAVAIVVDHEMGCGTSLQRAL
jgi:hypothetical protein